MCRNIKTLHNFDPPATDDEVHAAALQYVRKLSGTTKPSQANEAAFERAVREIAHISRHLLDDLVTTAPAARPRGGGGPGEGPGREAVRHRRRLSTRRPSGPAEPVRRRCLSGPRRSV